RRKLIKYQGMTGMGNLLCMLQFGSLPADLTRKSMELFAREVMPALKPLGDHTAQPVRQAAE
ncbi:MAG TPA: LLM class flavin-dependent oxidoreductase, partial [Alphaproteobacteria bacterium]